MYTQIRKNNEIPTTQKRATHPVQYIVELVFEDKKAKLKLNKDAMKLLEHIDMVKEARNLYKEGQVISWQEFIRNESR